MLDASIKLVLSAPHTSIHPSIHHLPNHTSIPPPTHPPTGHPTIHPLTHPPAYLSTIHPPIFPHTHPPIDPPTLLLLYPSIHSCLPSLLPPSLLPKTLLKFTGKSVISQIKLRIS